MKKIVKNKEPKKWFEHRTTEGAIYERIPELRDALLSEQGYICAYCMSRIGNSNEDSKIEHIISRTKLIEQGESKETMNYQNMVICCNGNLDGEAHCDTKKADSSISFNLFTDSFFLTLSYKSKTGRISSTNEIYDGELNNILNLNHSRLKVNRKNALDGVISSLAKLNWSTSAKRKALERWEGKNSEGKFMGYCGIVSWYLRKHLRRA